ncbi:MAG: hypothetical protein JWR59_1908 [Brevundimonas sp.]|nr:hypothetical protein [Brevundimonas sp.]
MTASRSIRIPAAGKEGKSMRKQLVCAAALGLSALAAPAFAQSTRSVALNTTVPAFCQPAIWPSAQTMALGSLVDGNGFLRSSFGGTTSLTSTNYYCNAPSKVTLSATPLTPITPVVVADTDSFTDKVNYVATLTWDDVHGTADSTATTATPIVAVEANIGTMILQLGSPTTPNGRRPVAANYAGAVTITVALQ